MKKETAASSKKKGEEDAHWAAAGEGQKSKAASRREAADAASDAAAAKRAEAKRLAQLEEEMASFGKPKAKGGAKKKMTKAEILAAEEAEALARAKARFAKAQEAKKEVSEEAYAATVDVANENANGSVEASGVDAAVDALKSLTTGGGGSTPQSTNMKAAFAAFQEVELPKLKEENPRLKKSQYDELLSKMWKKDPRNPQNFPKE